MRPWVGLLAALTAGGALAAGKDATEETAPPRLDVVFCVDTTGSMGDEIGVVKQKMREMVARIAAGRPAPDVRFGLVLYRDRGDEYVTKRYPLTRDVDAVVARIGEIVAHGGGDYAESVNEALHVAVQEMDWDPAGNVGRLLFLIGDAPPHLDYRNDFSYRAECGQAETQGIFVNTIACSGLQPADQRVFDEIAHATGGAAEQLTYRTEIARAGGGTEVVVAAGARVYAFGAGSAPAADWREGADVLAARGAVKAVEGGPMLAAAPAVASAAAMPGAPGGGGPAGPAGPAPRVGASGVAVVAQTNNLDYLLTRQVQVQLARQGVRFQDQPYLARQEWSRGSCAQRERRAAVAHTAEEWRRLWALIAEAEGKPEPPKVDFSRDMVLAVFGGAAAAGRAIRIADVWAEKDGLHVRVARGTEDPKAEAPYHFILVSRFDGKVVWH